MNPKELIERSLESGHGALNEADSKRLLGVYGIPVVDEAVCVDPDEAATRAEEIGFPVVLKGLGTKLTHKTERGLVRLGLNGPGEIIAAARKMADEAGTTSRAGWSTSGFGTQGTGGRTFQGRAIRPGGHVRPGGIFTEALDDVVFKVAPFTEAHAAHMLDQLRAKSLLGPFRGEASADRDALIKTLMGLSKLGVELEDVAEVDINPLLITPEGDVRAVDALVVTGTSPGQRDRTNTVGSGGSGRPVPS